MSKKNPSSVLDFTRGSELWIHQFRMFLTGLSNVLIVALVMIVFVVGSFLYFKIDQTEIYAVKKQIEITYKAGLGTPNQEIELYLNGKSRIVTPEQADKIITPYADRFWGDVKRAFILAILITIIIIGALIWYWYSYGRRVMEDEQLRGAKIVPKDRLIQMLKERNDASPYTIAGVPIRKGTEGNNICCVGAPQSGKSQAIRAFLSQVRNRNKKAVIYDPSGEFAQEFYREGKDIILNPFDERCPNWNLWCEVKEEHHIDSIGSSFYSPPSSGDRFFTDAAGELVNAIVRVLNTNSDLKTNKQFYETLSLSTLKDLHELLAGTPAANYVDPKTEKTGINILMTIVKSLSCFRFLKDEGELFSIRDWVADDDDSWVFITTKEEQKEAIKPLISFWISTVIKATMSLPAIHRERMWLCIDEMPTLNKMDDLITSLTNTRKYGLCHLVGLQDFSQLDQTYGKENGSTMISTLQTKLILRVTDSHSAERLSKIIGQMEVDEKNMSRSMGVSDGRDGDSFFSQRRERNVIMPAEIMSLPNMVGYLKIVGDYPITQVKTAYVPHANNALPFVPRVQSMTLDGILSNYHQTNEDHQENNIDLKKNITLQNEQHDIHSASQISNEDSEDHESNNVFDFDSLEDFHGGKKS